MRNQYRFFWSVPKCAEISRGLTSMNIKNAIASVAVKDMMASLSWYQKLFEREPDSRPMPEVAEWKFERGGWLQVYHLPERAGACSVTLAVSDLEEVIARLETLQIDTSTRTTDVKVKTVMIVDLDGNHIALAQALNSTIAQ